MIVEEEVWSLGLTQAQGSEAANKKLVLHPPEGLITICVQKRRGVNTPKAAHCNRRMEKEGWRKVNVITQQKKSQQGAGKSRSL